MKRITGLLFSLLLILLVFGLGGCNSASGAAAAGAGPATDPNAGLFEWVGDQNYLSPRHTPVATAELRNQLSGLTEDWYKDASFYHLWVKSFNDYDGDGVGDFRGITAKLDYIKNDLGCDAIWLSPIFDAAGKGTAVTYNMHGYDTTDYYAVNDFFGNEEHLETLIAEAHKRGIKLIFDFVPNHTSNRHPWFINSSHKQDNKDSWYLWSYEKLPWKPMGSTSTWHFNNDRQMNYYGAFWSGMPDLNFRNYEVREELKNVVRYWLNKGFDGVRIDAVRYLLEDQGALTQADRPGTFDWFSELRTEVIDQYTALGHPKFIVGEAWVGGNRTLLKQYFGSAEKPAFHMLFDFDFTTKVSQAVRLRSKGLFNMDAAPGAWGVFLSNHDNLSNRPGTVYGSPADLRLASALSLLVPATPFIYYGNEVGQPDQPNLGGQDIRLRYPLKWDLVESQKADPASLLNLHKALNKARSLYPALRRGELKLLDVSAEYPDVAVWSLSAGGQTVVCLVNLGTGSFDSAVVKLPADLSGNASSLILGSGQATIASGELTVTNLPSKAFKVVLAGQSGKPNLFAF